MESIESVISEDEVVFCIRMKGHEVEMFIQAEDEEEISAMLAVFIHRTLNGSSDEGSRRAGSVLLNAVDMAVAKSISESVHEDGKLPTIRRNGSDIPIN